MNNIPTTLSSLALEINLLNEQIERFKKESTDAKKEVVLLKNNLVCEQKKSRLMRKKLSAYKKNGKLETDSTKDKELFELHEKVISEIQTHLSAIRLNLMKVERTEIFDSVMNGWQGIHKVLWEIEDDVRYWLKVNDGYIGDEIPAQKK